MYKYIKKIINALLITILLLMPIAQANDMDYIQSYIVTVNPRVNGTLDINYELHWKVLKGTVNDIKIGVANSSIDEIKKITPNIKEIMAEGRYIKIYFNKAYNEGEIIPIKFSLHQSNIYKVEGNNCNYSFTPGWFSESKIGNMVVKWNKNSVKSSNANNVNGNYLLWSKSDLKYGETINVKLTYSKIAFKDLKDTSMETLISENWILLVLIIISVIGFLTSAVSYDGHRGFYDNDYRYRDNYDTDSSWSSDSNWSSDSSWSSGSNSSCACACAGGGRAGCSKKDLYGVKYKR